MTTDSNLSADGGSGGDTCPAPEAVTMSRSTSPGVQVPGSLHEWVISSGQTIWHVLGLPGSTSLFYAVRTPGTLDFPNFTAVAPAWVIWHEAASPWFGSRSRCHLREGGWSHLLLQLFLLLCCRKGSHASFSRVVTWAFLIRMLFCTWLVCFQLLSWALGGSARPGAPHALSWCSTVALFCGSLNSHCAPLRGGCISLVSKASPFLAVRFSAGQAVVGITIASSTPSACGDSCLFAAYVVCLLEIIYNDWLLIVF